MTSQPVRPTFSELLGGQPLAVSGGSSDKCHRCERRLSSSFFFLAPDWMSQLVASMLYVL